MKALLQKTPKGLRGMTPADQEAWAKFRRRLETMKPGTVLRMEWVSPRNATHHRKFFALLNLVAENSEVYNTVEKALVAVKLIVGHAEPFIDPVTGELTQLPKSIAYESMGQDEFEQFYNQAIDGIVEHVLTHIDRENADHLVQMIIEGWS